MKRIFTTIILSITLLSVDTQVAKLAGPRVGFTILTKGSSADFINGRDSYDDEYGDE